MKFETKVVHGQIKHSDPIHSKVTPIYQTSAFSFESLEELEGYYEGEGNYLYSRMGNPNTDELGHAIAELEGAPVGVASSSGMAAILAGVLAVAKNGDHVIAAEDLYGGTYHLLNAELKSFGIETTFVDFTDEKLIKAAIQENTKLIISETITNPFLRVENIEKIAKIANGNGLVSMLDNTFATPLLLQPFTNGIDLVVHSATKYIGGHSDVTAGVLVGREDLIANARARITQLGSNLSPIEAWLACRGLKTLALRVKKQCENALHVADKLVKHPSVYRVYYPHDVSEKGNGAILTIELEETCDISRFFSGLGWIKIVPTLAGVETSVSYPIGTSHRALPVESQKKLGINSQVVRISIGIEDAEDITSQFVEALELSEKF
jgi:cystathionine beta-lyase/cystathionine gamma-synthase